MSSFVALNIEPDEESEEEIDDTKEIQIEEALKLYLTALKLHSQGPTSYPEAKDAYDALFKSEIFKYPESLSEYEKTQLLDLEHEHLELFEESSAGPTHSLQPRDSSTASALPQTIYLSYKNHGQFILDSLRHAGDTNVPQNLTNAITSSGRVLKDFAEALERDDTDLELWRKSARVGDALRSYRIARFCLESVINGDGEGLDDSFDQLGLEQAFAVESLCKVVQRIDDRLSMIHLPLKRPRRAILQLLKAGVDPIPFLPSNLKDGAAYPEPRNLLGPTPDRRVLTPESLNWVDIGKAILQSVIANIESQTENAFTLEICLPDEDHKVEDQVTLPILQRVSTDESKHADQKRSEEIPDNSAAAEAENASEDIETNQAAGGEEVENVPTTDTPDKTVPPRDGPQRETTGDAEQDKPPNTVEEGDAKPSSAQTRKRSSTSAGNDEPADGGRVKSRRIRARESNAEPVTQPEEIAYDQARYFEDRLEMYTHADQWMFGTVGGLLSKLGVEDLGTIDELRGTMTATEQQRFSADNSGPISNESLLFQDLRDTVETWNDAKAQVALHGDIFSAAQDSSGPTKNSVLTIFLEHSRQNTQASGEPASFVNNEGISQFCQDVNMGKHHAQEVALKWLEQHLVAKLPDPDPSSSNSSPPTSSYASQQWPEPMREIVDQLVLKVDEFLCRTMLNFTERLEEDGLGPSSRADPPLKSRFFTAVELSQTVYELHLNIYASMKTPSSDCEEFSTIAQRDRLSRWRYISRTLINHYTSVSTGYYDPIDIMLRHLWASTLHLNMAEEVDQEHVLLCFQDLKRTLTSLRYPVINLMNNNTMPAISVAAVDKEVSKLKSKEFFMNIFDSNVEDPVHLIESIEPILDPSAIEYSPSPDAGSEEVKGDKPSQGTDPLVSRALNMASFLDHGDPTLRLYLWRLLQQAYDSIKYPPKAIWCHLRSLEIIVQELARLGKADSSSEHRQTMLLKWLRATDKLLTKLVVKVLDEPGTAFECFDMDGLRSSMAAVAKLSRLLHTFAAFEDALRVGQVSHPDIRPASTAKSLQQFKEKLRIMQVNAWLVQYALVREGIDQNKELFDTPLDDRIHYLRSVHNALGIREYCRYSNKLLLKLVRDELLTLQTEDGYESDIAQVLFDLYGLKFSPNLDAADHGCPIERLDRPVAIMMTDFVMLQTNQLNVRDLSKSDLKLTIDTVQKAIGLPSKSVPALTINKRILSNFLKSPINPQLLFHATRGISGLSMLPIVNDYANLAKKGWYFLHGSTALAKFRSQKRLGPTPTDDLDLAALFFRVDLELGSGRWETWYRLAQVYDLKLEEDIAWSADKLNNHRVDLATLQRKAIHAYAMAVAEATCAEHSTAETRKMVSDLYTEFGFRIYSSSREPLSMDAFSLSDSTKHFNNIENQQMYLGKPFKPMSVYSALNYASYLFRQAMVDRPKYWVNHYMFSKCLWKMFNYDEQTMKPSRPVEVEDILDSLVDAIDYLPSKKEPVFEPHFKYASIIHKLVKRGLLHPEEASAKLLTTPWAKNLTPVDSVESWKPFILEVLKSLRNADKSNWHHRIVARIAHVMYDDVQDNTTALAAKNELSQHIFTKAMTIQVWRPENERGGRHFVYTARYAHFFTGLLDQLDDRVNLELLLRRVRKKPHDYLNHGQLWEYMCFTYVKLFRRVANIPEGREEVVFKPLTYDEFIPYATRLEDSCQGPEADSERIDALRDAVDLKKLNAGLMKTSIFEDLIADAYAVFYEKNIAKVMEQASNEENRERMKVDHVLMAGDDEGTRTPTTSVQGGPTKGRTKGVTRKELQRKADAIATKSLASRQVAKPSRPAEEAPRQSAAEEHTEEPGPAKEAVKVEISAPEISLPVSLHDSADDESELSEIDEEKLAESVNPLPAMFPNLQIKRLSSPKPTSEPSANVSVVDDGDGDPAPDASAPDTKSEQAPPTDVEMDVDS